MRIMIIGNNHANIPDCFPSFLIILKFDYSFLSDQAVCSAEAFPTKYF